MSNRGRTSSEALTVLKADALQAVRIPQPPRALTDEQSEEWRAVVNRLPADWFQRETHALLAQYCRHVVAARRVAEMVLNIETEADKLAGDPEYEFPVLTYDRLLKMQEREGRAMTSLATKMRITQQSTYDKAKKKPAAGKRPWET